MSDPLEYTQAGIDMPWAWVILGSLAVVCLFVYWVERNNNDD